MNEILRKTKITETINFYKIKEYTNYNLLPENTLLISKIKNFY